MINNIKNNTYNGNRYEITNSNNKVSKIPTNLPQEDNVGSTLFKKYNKIESKANIEIVEKIQKEISKAELIAIKIVRGVELSHEEVQFISKRYPELKKTAEESVKENNNLKEAFKSYKTEKQIDEVISKLIKNIIHNENIGLLSKSQGKIKLSSVEELEKYIKELSKELKKVEIIAIKIVRGEKLTKLENQFISEKHPEIKKFAQEILMEYENLKEEIKNYPRDEKRQEILCKKIRYIEDMVENDILSEIQDVLKKEVIEKIKLYEQNKYKENDLKFYLYPYWYLLCNSEWPKIGIIVIVLVVGIFSIIN